ncbi:MAG: hypothetical protein H6818_18085 [Phycisphaerales bacterium]|nr:hypothetical protein [Phycisphaerales bacterium]
MKQTVGRDELIALTIFGLVMAIWFSASVYWILSCEPLRTDVYSALGFDTTRRDTPSERDDSFHMAFPLFLILGLGPVVIGLGVSLIGFAALSGAYSRFRGADGPKLRQELICVIGEKRWPAWFGAMMLRAFDVSAGDMKDDPDSGG